MNRICRVCVYNDSQFAQGDSPSFSLPVFLDICEEDTVIDHFSSVTGHYQTEGTMDVVYVVNGSSLVNTIYETAQELLYDYGEPLFIVFEVYEKGQWEEYVSADYMDYSSVEKLLFKFQDYLTEEL